MGKKKHLWNCDVLVIFVNIFAAVDFDATNIVVLYHRLNTGDVSQRKAIKPFRI